MRRVLNSVILLHGFVANPPVSVSVAVSFVWWRAAVCPEIPGLDCWPLTSSYTVYTKQCMYKIEKPGGGSGGGGREKNNYEMVVLHQIPRVGENHSPGV